MKHCIDFQQLTELLNFWKEDNSDSSKAVSFQPLNKEKQMQEVIRLQDMVKIRLLPKYASLKNYLRGAEQLWQLSLVSIGCEAWQLSTYISEVLQNILRKNNCGSNLSGLYLWTVVIFFQHSRWSKNKWMEREADRPSICVLLAACCLYMIYFQTTAFHNLITAPILNPKGIFGALVR